MRNVLGYGIVVLLLASLGLAIPPIPTVYEGTVSILDGSDPSGKTIRMVSSSFSAENSIDDDDTYLITFQTDDLETSSREGVRSGDSVTVFIENKQVATFAVEDFGVNKKDFTDVDLSEPVSSGSGSPSADSPAASAPTASVPVSSPTNTSPAAEDGDGSKAIEESDTKEKENDAVEPDSDKQESFAAMIKEIIPTRKTFVFGTIIVIALAIIAVILIYLRKQR